MHTLLNLKNKQISSACERIIARIRPLKTKDSIYILKKIFPESAIMRVRSLSEDILLKRESALQEFYNFIRTEPADKKLFVSIGSLKQDPKLFKITPTYMPTTFELKLTCGRVPIKEFFPECEQIACEKCITDRLSNIVFQTGENPWKAKITTQTRRRADICKKCGKLLTEKDKIRRTKLRLIYKCATCKHSGWNSAI